MQELTLSPDTSVRSFPDQPAATKGASWVSRRAASLIVTGFVVVYACSTIMSMRQTSTTFDEIIMSSAGARGYATGDFDLIVKYHPRIMSYLYGLPLFLSRPTYPPEDRTWDEEGDAVEYARELHFAASNDGPALAFRARLIAVGFGAALVILVFAFVRRHYGEVAAILATGMTAFLPDLLAHSGISYNDVPNALTFFAAVWSLDRAGRTPTVRTTAAAGVLVALALGVKYSAVALAPIAVCLLALETASRGRAWRTYLRRVLPLLPVAALVVYVALVVLYLGDVTLSSFRHGLTFNILRANIGQSAPALLLGEQRVGGFWYFFPVAFLIKTPAALHLLLMGGISSLVFIRPDRRALLRSPLRGIVVGALIFLVLLMKSDLNIGFRHALPIVPLVIVIAAAGLARIWHANVRAVRLVIVGLLVIQAASVLSWYPHFIPYTSEYFLPRNLGFARISDSSHDWGQGLPLLRDFMKKEGVSSIYLSYFGSAPPEAYGIKYVPLLSFFELEPQPQPAVPPRFLAISATNLSGAYVRDAFALFRRVAPYRVLGHSIFVYEVPY
jgi:hypothetical protein